ASAGPRPWHTRWSRRRSFPVASRWRGPERCAAWWRAEAMAAAFSQEEDDEITGINVTPLVDIVLVLLIIFMVTANFIVRETMEVDLPRAANAGATVQGLINVVMDRNGTLFVDGAETDEAGLRVKVAEGVKQDPDTRAIISADQSLPYGRVMHLIDLVKGEGVARFALNIEKDAQAAAPRP